MSFSASSKVALSITRVVFTPSSIVFTDFEMSLVFALVKVLPALIAASTAAELVYEASAKFSVLQ